VASCFRTYRVQDGKRIDGVFFFAFIHNGSYYLSPISIYQDGLIDCWGLVDFEGFKQKVRSGWVVTQPPEGARVSVPFLADFRAADAYYWVQAEELIKEVADEIEELNHRPSSVKRCYEAYKQFQDNPTEGTRDALRKAYEAVPEHNRTYVLGDMDVKDIPIRMIIYGEHEIGNWSHRIVARNQGMKPLPSIKIKTVERNKKKKI
jgi:hypothetical protein